MYLYIYMETFARKDHDLANLRLFVHTGFFQPRGSFE